MLNILAYTDGKPTSIKALVFAAELCQRLEAQMAVMTIRSGTHATEEPPPVGQEIATDNRLALPDGINILLHAVDHLTANGLLTPQPSITIRDVPHGYLFLGSTPDGQRIPFYERYGAFMEVLNRDVTEHGYDLLVVAPPRRGLLRKILLRDTSRLLALNLHTSLLVVRGGTLDSRFLICTDGSPSARRIFPLLRELLPAIKRPLDLICVQPPEQTPENREAARECLAHAKEWLGQCSKAGALLQPQGTPPLEAILKAAGSGSVVVMGASLRHDVYRRMVGTLPMRVLDKTPSSVLLVNLPPEADADFLKDPINC